LPAPFGENSDADKVNGSTAVRSSIEFPRDSSKVALGTMSTIHEIEAAVSKLSREELSVFREWFSKFDAAAWDKQFAADVAAGQLDELADEAIRDLREGRCTDL
jgi:hypothetical protein